MRRRIALPVALLLFSLRASGAELFYMDHDPVTDQFVGPVGPLVISGEIAAGDYDSLVAKIIEDEDRFLTQNKILLASDGGDVTEALRIAKFIKALYAAVIVGPATGRCVSACFFIYAAANQREVDGERLLGINRPYFDTAAPLTPPDTASVESAGLTQVRAFLKDNAVPTYLVEEMFRRGSSEAYWLSADDARNLGFRSASFTQFLVAKCAWDDRIEHEAYAGKGSFDDLKQMLKCRERVTREAAHQALLLARQQRPAH